jgi:hypothetical protein
MQLKNAINANFNKEGLWARDRERERLAKETGIVLVAEEKVPRSNNRHKSDQELSKKG